MRGRLLVVGAVVLCTLLGGSAWALWTGSTSPTGVLTPPVVVNPAVQSAVSTRSPAPPSPGPSVSPSAAPASGLGEPIATSVPVDNPSPSPTGTPAITPPSPVPSDEPQTVPREVEPVDGGDWHWPHDDRPDHHHHDDDDH